MENASKAILMAAGILIGMLVLGMFVYLFRAGGRVGEIYEEKQSQQQLQLINSKFENYNKNQKLCEQNNEYNTIIDMVSLTNLAINTNEEFEYSTYQTVEIEIILSASVVLKVRPQEELERNYLFKGDSGSSKVYVYDLFNKEKSALGSALGGSVSVMDDGDTLTKVNDKMVYKYCFVCTDMKYNEASGRINYMKFELMENPNFTL